MSAPRTTIELSPKEAAHIIQACVTRLRSGVADRDALDRIILLHQPSDPDEYDGAVDCTGCFNEWPCPTQAVLAEWGQS